MLKAVDGKLPEFVEALVGPGRVDPNYLPPENDLPAVLAAAKKGFPQLNSKNFSYQDLRRLGWIIPDIINVV